MARRLAHVGSQPLRRKVSASTGAPSLPAQFGRRDEQFFLGVSLQAQIGRAAGNPLALHLRKGRREVKWIVAYRDSGFDHLGIAEGIVPVVEMVHLHATALLEKFF